MSNKPVPQDHKKKEEKIKTERVTRAFRLDRTFKEREIEGVALVYEGTDIFLPDESMQDHYVLEHMALMREEGRKEGWRYPLILRRLIGEEQAATVAASSVDPETGRPDDQKIGRLINVLFEAANPNS